MTKKTQMKQEFEIFEYLPGKSLLYKINPAIKFFFLIIVCLFLTFENIYFFLAPGFLIIFFFLCSEVYVKKQVVAMWKIFIFFIIIGIVKFITSGSVFDSSVLSFRLIFMTIAGILFYSTTRLSSLRLVFTKIFSKRISDIFIMMLAFLPILFKTAKEQKEARYCKSFKIRRNVFRSIKMISIPLLIDMLVKTDEMADAWYSRGYRGD